MPKGKFVIKYIAECSGSNQDPIIAAKKEIEEIEGRLRKADVDRSRRLDLVAVLEHLGDSTYRRHRTIPDPPDIDLMDDCIVAKDLRRRIVRAIESKGPMTVREIITKVGSYRDDASVIRAIKFLGDMGIIERDGSSENKVIPGGKWDQQQSAF